MNGVRYTGGSDRGEVGRVFTKRNIIKYVIFVFIICILSVMQTSFVKINSNNVVDYDKLPKTKQLNYLHLYCSYLF